jgi:hypothetical protein
VNILTRPVVKIFSSLEHARHNFKAFFMLYKINIFYGWSFINDQEFLSIKTFKDLYGNNLPYTKFLIQNMHDNLLEMP